MKKSLKMSITKIFILICIAFLMTSACSTVFGANNNILMLASSSSGDSNFNPSEFNSGGVESEVTDVVQNTSETIVAVLRVVSVAIAIIVLLVIAMKYMMSSAGDRADIKKHAVAYVTGTFILFAAAQIIAILIEVSDKLFSGE